jgi:hypothetical protein
MNSHGTLIDGSVSATILLLKQRSFQYENKSLAPAQARGPALPAIARRSVRSFSLRSKMSSSLVQFPVPFVVFLGDLPDETFCKTGMGLVQWRRAECVGQIRLPGCGADAEVPDLNVAQAKAAGARSLIVGSAVVGGGLPEGWIDVLCEAARAGIDIVAGLHLRLAALPGLGAAADAGAARLIDIRVPPPGLPVGTGQKRSGR